MFNIIPPILLIVSLGGLIILIEKNKSKNTGNEPLVTSNLKISQIFSSVKKYLTTFNYNTSKQILSLSEKILIRLRIIILRVDRVLFRSLHILKKHKNKSQDLSQLKYIHIIKEKLNPSLENANNQINKKKIATEITKLEKKLEKDNKDIDVLLNLVRLYLFVEDNASARYYLLKAFKLDNNNQIVKDLISSIFEKETNNSENNTSFNNN